MQINLHLRTHEMKYNRYENENTQMAIVLFQSLYTFFFVCFYSIATHARMPVHEYEYARCMCEYVVHWRKIERKRRKRKCESTWFSLVCCICMRLRILCYMHKHYTYIDTTKWRMQRVNNRMVNWLIVNHNKWIQFRWTDRCWHPMWDSINIWMHRFSTSPSMYLRRMCMLYALMPT